MEKLTDGAGGYRSRESNYGRVTLGQFRHVSLLCTFLGFCRVQRSSRS